MKEYTISYVGWQDGQKIDLVGSGYGNNEEEAVDDFMVYHSDICEKIEEVKFYKNCDSIFVA